MPEVVVAIVVIVLVLIVLIRAVRIVPQARAAVVERLGRYQRVLTPGLALVVPFVDKVRPVIDLREQVQSFPPQPVITADNLMVSIDTVLYFQVTDPKAATYEIASYLQGVEQLTVTTLRDVVGRMDLERTLTSREEINNALRGTLDEATGKWGIRVNRVELKAIEPPASIQDSMEKQMRADRDKRAAILTAEGQRQSQILSAEGSKQSSVLRAEGERQALILTAEADRQARILRAQGEAEAIGTVFKAIHEGRPDPALLSYQYLQTLPQIAKGESNKLWIVPSELTQALAGLGGLAGNLAGGQAGGQAGGSGTGADGHGSTGAAPRAPSAPAAPPAAPVGSSPTARELTARPGEAKDPGGTAGASLSGAGLSGAGTEGADRDGSRSAGIDPDGVVAERTTDPTGASTPGV